MKARRLVGLMFVAALVAVTVSCGIDRAAAPDPTLAGPEFGALGLSKLLKCSATPAATISLRVNQAGGTLKVGKHKLVIPAGALNRSTLITMSMEADTTNSVQLQPEGLVFNAGKPAVLTLNYDNCPLPASILPRRVAYTTDGLRILQLLPSVDDKLSKKVSTNLEHFSRYAVAW